MKTIVRNRYLRKPSFFKEKIFINISSVVSCFEKLLWMSHFQEFLQCDYNKVSAMNMAMPELDKRLKGFYVQSKIDLFVTGLSKFLALSEMAKLLTGSAIEINKFPFSFANYIHRGCAIQTKRLSAVRNHFASE